MCRFFESIKLKDGKFYRLKQHQERVNKAFAACYPTEEPFEIVEYLFQYGIPQEGIYKFRMQYDSRFESMEFMPYTQRKVSTLKLVETNMESYAYKREDRAQLNEAFAQRGDCDDVLLVKNGLLTDTSYSNIALFDGDNWFTPRLPLLQGTNRADLVEREILREKDIAVADLKNYQQIALFNAMIEFGELMLEIDSIKY